MKITGTTNSCRECPYRAYYSGGVYECTKAGDVQITRGETDAIPEWCPLPNYPIVRAPVSPVAWRYQMKEGWDGIWHEKGE